MKLPRLSTSILILATCLFISNISPSITLAIDTGFFSANDILFYNPDDGGCKDTTNYGSATKTKTLKEFVDKYGQGAFDIGKKYGIPYEAMLSQAILESGYGKSELTYKYYNFFGMKAGSDWKGETVTMGTDEEYKVGVHTKISAAFRVYPSIEAGWEGYGQFITGYKRYKEALKYPGDYVNYLKEIKKAGYATSSSYVKNTVSIANAVADYIKSTGKWPPSSEVAKTNVPTGSSGSSSSSQSDCDNQAAVGDIVATALNFAIDKPVKNGVNQASDAKPAYITALNGLTPADCGHYVGAVMTASKVDENYPKSGTSNQLSYVKKTTDKYKIIEKPKQSDLVAGDILIVVNDEGDHHTMIYTGSSPYPAVDASQDKRIPSVRDQSDLTWMLGRSGVIAARFIGNE